MKTLTFVLLVLCFTITPVLAGEDDLYDFLWLDPDKSVYVLQNKIYPKDKTFYVDIGYINALSGSFQNTQGAQLKGGYYFKEEWAIEYNYMQYANSNNSANDNVEFVAEVAPFVRRPLNSNSIFLIYSPFYGKINTFNKIYYFDVSFGLGTGTYNMESNLKTATDPTQNKFETETYTPVQVKVNTKFHLNKNLHLGVEFMSTNFQAEDDPSDQSKKTWTRHNDLIFSIGVSF